MFLAFRFIFHILWIRQDAADLNVKCLALARLDKYIWALC